MILRTFWSKLQSLWERERSGVWLHTWALLPAAFLAGWPVLEWMGRRALDGGEEPWGLLAVGLAMGLTPKEVWLRPVTTGRMSVALAGLVVSAWVMIGTPPLLRGLVWALSVAVLTWGGGGSWGRLGLWILALPVTASLQFYAGYPLRVVAAEASRFLLSCFGVMTQREGVVLQWAGGDVIVDAPCSGVQMLWTSALLAAALCAGFRMRFWRTAHTALATMIIVLAANAVRVTLLFFVESGLWPWARPFHEAIGLMVFAVSVVGVFIWTRGKDSLTARL
ncbi:MAG TPA: archaeosortase/exosortase family protein [Opitutaceae bacterium]|nr:archaeosortase/exosortase family protein [Opitutaceae bacterium]